MPHKYFWVGAGVALGPPNEGSSTKNKTKKASKATLEGVPRGAN